MILKEGAQPVFLKARPIPYSLCEKVERELDRFQKDGVISRVDWSDWATPIVVVPTISYDCTCLWLAVI